MINQLRADLYAIGRTGPVLICLAVAVLAAALYTVLQHSLAAGDLGPEAASGVQVLSDALMVSLMGPLLFGALVAQPFETKSVHDSLLASGRGAFVGAKTVLTAAAVTALSLPYGIAVLIGLATEQEFARRSPPRSRSCSPPAAGSTAAASARSSRSPRPWPCSPRRSSRCACRSRSCCGARWW